MTVEELLARCELVRASEKRLTECQPFSCGESAAMMEYNTRLEFKANGTWKKV